MPKNNKIRISRIEQTFEANNKIKGLAWSHKQLPERHKENIRDVIHLVTL